MNNKKSWLAAITCCLFVAFSQLIMDFFTNKDYSGHFIENTIVAILFLLIAVFILRMSITGIVLSIVVPITFIILLISTDFIVPMNFRGDLEILFLISLSIPIFPSVVLGFMMLKYHKSIDARANDDEDNNKKNGVYTIILSVIYSFAMACILMHFLVIQYMVYGLNPIQKMYYGFNNIIIYHFFLLCIFSYYLVMILRKNELARKISIVAPFVVLFTSVNPLMTSLLIKDVYICLLTFLLLWLLSLHFYRKRKNKVILSMNKE